MQRQCRAAGSTVLQVLRLEAPARAGGQAASGAGPGPRRATLPPPPHPLSLPQAGVERIGAEDAQEGGNLLEVPEGVLHVLVGEGALEVDVEEDREPALRAEQGVLPARRERPRPPLLPALPPPPRGRLSILVRSISRSAKAERALKSSPGPSRSPNTTEVFRRSAPPPAPAPPGAPPSGVGGWGSRARWMKRVKLSLLSWMSSARTSRP